MAGISSCDISTNVPSGGDIIASLIHKLEVGVYKIDISLWIL